jgi:hypothetical protein
MASPPVASQMVHHVLGNEGVGRFPEDVARARVTAPRIDLCQPLAVGGRICTRGTARAARCAHRRRWAGQRARACRSRRDRYRCAPPWPGAQRCSPCSSAIVKARPDADDQVGRLHAPGSCRPRHACPPCPGTGGGAHRRAVLPSRVETTGIWALSASSRSSRSAPAMVTPRPAMSSGRSAALIISAACLICRPLPWRWGL